METKEEKKYTLEQSQRYWAPTLFNQCWKLLEKPDRTEEDDELLKHAAHGSMYHWLQVGEPINKPRGEWMLARVYTILEDGEIAKHHADRCLVMTLDQELKDFDLGYAYEAVARVSALLGDKTNFEKYYQLASETEIAKQEDKEWFDKDLEKGPWFGMK